MKRILALLLTIISLAFIPATAYAKGEEMVVAKGVDVSYWQGTKVDWQKVKDSGYTFAILRVGYSGKKDTTFEENYKKAKEVGIKVGVYMYCYAVTESAAVCDAEDVTKWLDGKTLEYPVFYDMEDDYKNMYLGKLNNNQRTAVGLAFVKKMQENGFYTGIYANKNWFENKLNLTEIKAKCDCLWIAQYPYSVSDYSKYYGQYDIWQYASDGSVSGIDGNVDVNVSYLDFSKIIQDGGYNGYPKYIAPTGIRGDVNGDNELSLTDVVTLARYIAGWRGIKLVKEELNADRSEDSAVELSDVVYLARMVAGWKLD